MYACVAVLSCIDVQFPFSPFFAEEDEEDDEEEEEEEVEEIVRKIRLHDKLCYESLKRNILEKFRISEDTHDLESFEMKFRVVL